MMPEALRFRGTVIRLGDNIDTDAIIPARHLNLTDAKKMAKHCFEEVHPDFRTRALDSRIVVAGDNFGCGSSREHAPLAIQGCGITCVIAVSFARLFFRNSINIGLPLLAVDQADAIANGDELDVDVAGGEVRNLKSGKLYRAKPLPPFIQELLLGGGAIPYIDKKLASC